MEMGEIAGVSAQRQGQVSSNETLGGVERSVNQSSHITEFWFHTHEQVKLRVLTAFLETAKVALKGNNKKVQYILDDQSIEMLNIDGEEFSEADYGMVCTSSSKTAELEQAIKQYAQAFLQNGGSMSTIMDIYFSPSLSDMKKKLEIAEENVNTRNAKAAEDNNKLAQQAQLDTKEFEDKKLLLQDTISIRENDTKIYIAELQASMKQSEDEGMDEDNDGIKDELETSKLELSRDQAKADKLLKIRQLDDSMKMHKDKMEREDKKIVVSKQKKVTK